MKLREKLFSLQQMFKTFAVSEESAKRDAKNSSRSAYSYTPGWKIVEAIREAMDSLEIMLDSTTVSESHEMISYPVYREVNGQVHTFEKKEMYVTVTRAFTWVDVKTGETIGPIIHTAAGANGTDKSLASAEAFCERYFLLKQFHITTRELNEEPDAHDSGIIDGNMNPLVVPTSGRMVAAQQSQYQPRYQSQMQVQMQQQVQQPSQQPTMKPEDYYEQAVSELSNYGPGTITYKKLLVSWLSRLNQVGYDTSNPGMVEELKKVVQTRRGVAI